VTNTEERAHSTAVLIFWGSSNARVEPGSEAPRLLLQLGVLLRGSSSFSHRALFSSDVAWKTISSSPTFPPSSSSDSPSPSALPTSPSPFSPASQCSNDASSPQSLPTSAFAHCRRHRMANLETRISRPRSVKGGGNRSRASNTSVLLGQESVCLATCERPWASLSAAGRDKGLSPFPNPPQILCNQPSNKIWKFPGVGPCTNLPRRVALSTHVFRCKEVGASFDLCA
jgi:hypothetical protein